MDALWGIPILVTPPSCPAGTVILLTIRALEVER